MENLEYSYFECLKYMGISNSNKEVDKRIYNEGKYRIYSQLKKLDLNENMTNKLIKSFNERVLKIDKKFPYDVWSTNYREFIYCDIRDHFVITNIIFDMNSKTFNSKYVFYRNMDCKSSIYIGIEGVDNQILSIPNTVVKINDTGVFKKGYEIPEYPKFFNNRDAVRLNITQEGINAANKRIERGIQTNWEGTHNPSAILSLKNNKFG